jgi:hypothetical protein
MRSTRAPLAILFALIAGVAGCGGAAAKTKV